MKLLNMKNKMGSLRQSYSDMSVHLKAGVWFTICGFIQKAISMLCTPIFTRILTEEQYGIVSTYSAWQIVVNLIVTVTLYRSIMNLYVKYENKEKVLSTVCSLSICMTSCWLILTLLFLDKLAFLFRLSKELVLCLILFSIGESIIQCWMIYKRYIYDYKPAIFVSLIITAMSGVGGVICVWKVKPIAEWKTYPQVVAYLVIGLAIYLRYLIKERCFFDKDIWLFSLSFCLGLMPHYLSEFVLQSSDKIMIDYMCGKEEVAYYSIAYSVGVIISLFSNAINASFVPYQYQMISEKKGQELSKTANRIMLLLAFILCTIMLMGREIVYIFGGQNYVTSAKAIIPICIGVYFNYMFQMFARVQEYYNRKLTIVFPSILCACLNVLLNYLFIPQFGYIAAAYTTFFCFALFCFIHFVFCKRTFAIENGGENLFDGKSLFATSVGLIVSGGLILVVQQLYVVKYSFIFALVLFGSIKRKTIYQAIRNELKVVK